MPPGPLLPRRSQSFARLLTAWLAPDDILLPRFWCPTPTSSHVRAAHQFAHQLTHIAHRANGALIRHANRTQQAQRPERIAIHPVSSQHHSVLPQCFRGPLPSNEHLRPTVDQSLGRRGGSPAWPTASGATAKAKSGATHAGGVTVRTAYSSAWSSLSRSRGYGLFGSASADFLNHTIACGMSRRRSR